VSLLNGYRTPRDQSPRILQQNILVVFSSTSLFLFVNILCHASVADFVILHGSIPVANEIATCTFKIRLVLPPPDSICDDSRPLALLRSTSTHPQHLFRAQSSRSRRQSYKKCKCHYILTSTSVRRSIVQCLPTHTLYIYLVHLQCTSLV